MLKIAICDDNRNDLNTISYYIKSSVYGKKEQSTIYEYTNPEEMLEKDRQYFFDVFFLDILLEGTTGFEVASKIKMYNDKAYIVFVTIDQELVYDSFKYMPFGFLRKNRTEYIKEDINDIILRIQYMKNKEKNIVLELPYTERKIVSCKEVIMLLSHRNYIIVCLKNNEEFKVRGTIKKWEELLKDTQILRVNRTCLVNIEYILKLDKNNIYISSNKIIPLGKKYADFFLEKYFEMKRIK